MIHCQGRNLLKQLLEQIHQKRKLKDQKLYELIFLLSLKQ